MNAKKIQSLLVAYNGYRHKCHLREGQSLMNALREVDREAYVEITGTEADPFYDDSKIQAFWESLKHRKD